jgi:hypothetical protein
VCSLFLFVVERECEATGRGTGDGDLDPLNNFASLARLFLICSYPVVPSISDVLDLVSVIVS